MNKKGKKIALILTVLILAIVLVHVAVFIYLNINGKNLLKNYIKTKFTAEADVSAVSFRFPFTVVVKGFKCGDVEFNKADVSLGLFNPFNRSISLSKVYIDKLNFKVKIEKDKVSVVPFFVKQKEQAEQPVVQAEEVKEVKETKPEGAKPEQKNVSIKIGKLFINNASAQITDLTGGEPVTFNLRKVGVVLKHFIYPKLPKFYVELNASLDKDDIKSDNIIAIKGWVDYAHRNMDVKFDINNVDYVMFSNYYPPFWKPDNLGVKDAKLSLNSKLNSLNNDLVIEAVLALDKIEFLEAMQNDSRVNSLRTMIAFFNDGNGKPVLPIKLRTKMDSFHIDFASLQSEFKGKMKLDIGTIVINILDKARGATIDKAVDTTKDAAMAVKDVTVDKTANTIKSIVGAVSSVINGKTEKQVSDQPSAQANEAAPQETVKPVEQGDANTPAAEATTEVKTEGKSEEKTGESVPEKTEENTTVQPQAPQQANTEEKNTNTVNQTNTSNETQVPNTQTNTETQSQSETQNQT